MTKRIQNAALLQVQILLSPNSIEDQKKGFHRILKGFCHLNRVKIKKKGFYRNWYYIRPEFGICLY